jgi:NCS1 family nucleobase:cation symporter-1
MGIPSLIGQYEPQIISMAAQNMYRMGWLLTFTTSAVIYYLTTLFIKPRIFPLGRETTPLKWEWLANDGREGFFEEERNDGEICVPATPPMIDAEEVDMSEKGEKAQRMSY